MANEPARARSSALRRPGMGARLLGLGVVLFVVTRIVVWLPLGFVGSWINGFIWPVLLLCLVAGAGLMWISRRN